MYETNILHIQMREGANDFHKYLLFSKLGSVDVYPTSFANTNNACSHVTSFHNDYVKSKFRCKGYGR